MNTVGLRNSSGKNRVRKLAKAFAACLLGAILILTLTLTLASPAKDMPTRLWIHDAGRVTQRVRIESPTGPDFTDRRLVSTTTNLDGTVAALSFGRKLTGLDQLKLRFSPKVTLYSAGYAETNQTAEDQDEEWREFTMFDPHYGKLEGGWWPW